MEIKKIHSIYFSPVHHTREIAGMMANALARVCGLPKPHAHDATPLKADMGMFLPEDELAVFAAPVFGGRIPATAAGRFKQVRGNGTPAILLAAYGNRAYEDALLELKDLAEAGGFKPVAAAACIAEHTIAPQCATGRPDASDKAGMENFAASIAKILSGSLDEAGVLAVPGNHPYREFKRSPLPQSVDGNCVDCGICSQSCPTGAIDFENPAIVAREKCICCMRCVHICPQKARHPAPAFLEAVGQRLAPFCGVRKENEYFVAAAK